MDRVLSADNIIVNRKRIAWQELLEMQARSPLIPRALISQFRNTGKVR